VVAAVVLAGEARAQWAVFDATNAANMLTSISTLGKQLTQLEATYNQLQASYHAVTGARGLGDVLNNPALRQYLPTDWMHVYDAAKAGGLPGISGTLKAIEVAEAPSGSVADQLAEVSARSQLKAPTDKAVGVTAYQGAQARVAQLDALMKLASNTQDEKAALEVQARVTAEVAAVQEESMKLQLVALLQQAEEKLIQDRKQAIAEQMFNPANTGMPPCCSAATDRK